MPGYGFFCHACKKIFSRALRLAEYKEGEVTCPECGSSNVEASRSALSAITSKKSA